MEFLRFPFDFSTISEEQAAGKVATHQHETGSSLLRRQGGGGHPARMQAASHRGCSFSTLDQEGVTKLGSDLHMMGFCVLLFI